MMMIRKRRKGERSWGRCSVDEEEEEEKRG